MEFLITLPNSTVFDVLVRLKGKGQDCMDEVNLFDMMNGLLNIFSDQPYDYDVTNQVHVLIR